MPVDPIMYITLQELIIFAQREKEKLLRNGAGLPETIPTDAPDIEDYVPGIAEEAHLSLMDRIAARKRQQQEDPQLTMEEVIACAETNNASDVHDDTQIVRVGAMQRLREYFDALKSWRIEKERRKFEYECLKIEVAHKCHGFDVMIEKINKIIKDYNKIQVNDVSFPDHQSLNQNNPMI